METTILNALKGTFSKEFRDKLKKENLRGILGKLEDKEKRLKKRLDNSNSESQLKVTKKKLKIIGAQRKKVLKILNTD